MSESKGAVSELVAINISFAIKDNSNIELAHVEQGIIKTIFSFLDRLEEKSESVTNEGGFVLHEKLYEETRDMEDFYELLDSENTREAVSAGLYYTEVDLKELLQIHQQSKTGRKPADLSLKGPLT